MMQTESIFTPTEPRHSECAQLFVYFHLSCFTRLRDEVSGVMFMFLLGTDIKIQHWKCDVWVEDVNK